MGGLGKVGGGVPVWVPAPRFIYARMVLKRMESNVKNRPIPK
jgi:hypothetical protein